MSRWAGVDVGGTKVLGVLVDDATGAVIARTRLASRPGADGVVGAVLAAVAELVPAEGPDRLAGVGIGVPGVVDPGAGTVTHAVNLGLTEPLDLAGLVAEQLGVPVRVENDLNAAALGAAEVLRVAHRDLAFLALGTGLAAGLLLDGRLRRGASGAAGEVGHVPFSPTGPRCACGQRGCLEVYGSGRAMAAAWAGRPADAAVRAPAPEPVLVADAAADGEAWAVAAWGDLVAAVATAVRVLVLTCDVEHVVLGGGVAGLGARLLDPVRAALAAQAEDSPFLASLRVADRLQLVDPGTDPAAVGAALAVRSAVATAAPV